MRRRAGFTLIELMVSLSIFCVLAVALYSVFAAGVGAWRRAQASSATYQTTRLVLDEMARDLRGAVLISNAEFAGEPARLSLLVVRRGSTPAIRRLTYELRQDSLFRLDESYVEGLQETHRQPDLMVGPLAGLVFEYASRGEGTVAALDWKDVWADREALPAGVRIVLTSREGQTATTRFTKTVFIPLGFREREVKK